MGLREEPMLGVHGFKLRVFGVSCNMQSYFECEYKPATTGGHKLLCI